ncbi:hypothetical protein [Sinomonas soli]
MRSRRRRDETAEQAAPAPAPERAYYRLTLSHEEVGRQLALAKAVDAAHAALEGAQAVLAAADERVGQLDQDQQFRDSQRASLLAQADEQAAANDLALTASAETLLKALDRVDAAQAKIAEAARTRREELARRAADAADALAAAEQQASDFAREHAGKVARILVDWVVRREVCRILDGEYGEQEPTDSAVMVDVFAALPDFAAEQVAAHPASFQAAMLEELTPKRAPRPTRAEAERMVDEGNRLLAEYAAEEEGKRQALLYGRPALAGQEA